jgi:hypothetical protein
VTQRCHCYSALNNNQGIRNCKTIPGAGLRFIAIIIGFLANDTEKLKYDFREQNMKNI